MRQGNKCSGRELNILILLDDPIEADHRDAFGAVP
jgi:hypothetical protein